MAEILGNINPLGFYPTKLDFTLFLLSFPISAYACFVLIIKYSCYENKVLWIRKRETLLTSLVGVWALFLVLFANAAPLLYFNPSMIDNNNVATTWRFGMLFFLLGSPYTCKWIYNAMVQSASADKVLITAEYFDKQKEIGYNVPEPPALENTYTIITGTTSGIGLALAHEIHDRGGPVCSMVRNLEKQKETQMPWADVVKVDFASMKSVKESIPNLFENIEGFLSKHSENVGITLALNAGLHKDNWYITEDNMEETLQANHFGQFYLLVSLLNKYQYDSRLNEIRIVILSSIISSSIDPKTLYEDLCSIAPKDAAILASRRIPYSKYSSLHNSSKLMPTINLSEKPHAKKVELESSLKQVLTENHSNLKFFDSYELPNDTTMMWQYCTSKAFNQLAALAIARAYKIRSADCKEPVIVCNAVHPGIVDTSFYKGIGEHSAKLKRKFDILINLFSKTAVSGCQPSLVACRIPKSGMFFIDADTWDDFMFGRPYSLECAVALWKATEIVAGIKLET